MMLINLQLIVIIIIFVNIKLDNCDDDLIPNFCFQHGFCSFRLASKFASICTVKCGSSNGVAPDQLCISDSDALSRPFYCWPRDYTADLSPEDHDLLPISLGICGDSGCLPYGFNSSIHILSSPEFDETIVAYDSIEHELDIHGDHFDGLYFPRINIQYHQKDGDSSYILCEFDFNCTTVDDNNLNCLKHQLTDECLLDENEKNVEILVFSHDLSQDQFNVSFILYRTPNFISVIWEPTQNRFIINSTTPIILNSQVTCSVQNSDDIEPLIAQVTISRETFSYFELDPRPLFLKTLNCTIQMAKLSYPLGLVTISSLPSQSIWSILSFIRPSILLIISGTAFLMATIIGTIKLKSSSKIDLNVTDSKPKVKPTNKQNKIKKSINKSVRRYSSFTS